MIIYHSPTALQVKTLEICISHTGRTPCYRISVDGEVLAIVIGIDDALPELIVPQAQE